MEEAFSIDISYNGTELSFDAKLVSFGYSYKILVKVNDIEVSFEPDENHNYRAIVQGASLNSLKEKERSIIRLITERLDSLKDLS